MQDRRILSDQAGPDVQKVNGLFGGINTPNLLVAPTNNDDERTTHSALA